MNRSDCFASEEELNIYLDGELGVSRKGVLDRHLSDCRICFLRFEIASRLKTGVREAVRDYRAPDWLRGKIVAGISEESKAEVGGFWRYLINILKTRPFIPVGAAGLLVVMFLLAIIIRPSQKDSVPFVTEMVREHYEYLEGGLENGIKSDDPKEITRWISVNAGIDFPLSPDSGLPSLNGACVIREDRERIGYISFDYLEKKVSLFMTKNVDEELSGPRKLTVHDIPVFCGRCTDMNYVLWQGKSIVCMLVGDLPEDKLIDLADIII